MMKVTVLIENRPSPSHPNLKAEWGLSLYISFQGHNILFDSGISGAFAENAASLSVDIPSIETAVLSHHHYDHGGGLRRFFKENPAASVYLGEPPKGDCYSRFLPFMKSYVGLDKTILSDYPDRFKFVSDPTEILPDVYVIPHLSGTYPRPLGNKSLFVLSDGRWVLDDFAHEVALAIKENDSLVIFTGCSHNGVLNMVDTVSRNFPGLPVKSVIGGFHLFSLLPFIFAGRRAEIRELGKLVLDYPVAQTYTGHCTGNQAFAILKSVMGERLTDLKTGDCFEV
jgi:7,8-dihydropterin-6-yl-methyl-4-(beta-D-ribofuranosyl)aminobenzene 5'-phosphate synthase